MKLTDPYFRLEFDERRRQALTRDCPDCPATIGQPLEHWPAHTRRERP